jgi:hypothetical protein
MEEAEMRVARAAIGFPLKSPRLWANASIVLRLIHRKSDVPASGSSYDAVRHLERERVLMRERIDRLAFAARPPL